MEVTVTVKPTPEQLAEEWWNNGDDYQARFFNRLGEITKDDGWRFVMQLQYIASQGGLTLEGRRVLQAFHEYSHEGDRV